MPRWTPKPLWKNEDVFIIGGGASLRDFNWDLLILERTIGCNTAFTLGKDVCKICIFGDAKWFRKHERQLAQYAAAGGIVFTNCLAYQRSNIDWLWTLPRKPRGLGLNELGWNKNTGASALNLALILGAKRVFLLGFDMHLSPDRKPNWHDQLIDKPNPKVYRDFILNFTYVAMDLKRLFPGREVINVTDDSDLDVFPKVGCSEFWTKRKGQKWQKR